LSNLGDEVLAALHEAERLVATLPPGSTEQLTAIDLAAELREICDRLIDADLPASVAGARQAVYAAQALLRVLGSRQVNARVASPSGTDRPTS
jgi:hypothetical protein